MAALLAAREIDGEAGKRQAGQLLIGDAGAHDLPQRAAVGGDRKRGAGEEPERPRRNRDEPPQPNVGTQDPHSSTKASRAIPCA